MSSGSTQQKKNNMHLKNSSAHTLRAPGCTHASLRTPHKRAQTRSRSFEAAQGHCFDLVPCYLISLPLEKKKSTASNGMLLLSVLSSYLYGTTNPAQPVHPPPLQLTNAVALIGLVSFTTGSGAESRTERAGRLIETSPNARSPAVPRSLVPTLSCCLELTFSLDNICPRQAYSGRAWRRGSVKKSAPWLGNKGCINVI